MLGHRRGQILTVRQFLADITEWGWPAASHRPLIFARDIPDAPHPLPCYLPPDADRRLAAALEQRSASGPSPLARLHADALLLTRATGLRLGELRDLELDCVHQIDGHGAWLKVPLGKLGTERMVPLDEETLDVVDRIVARRTPPTWADPVGGLLRLYCWAPYGVAIGNFSVMSPSVTPRILVRFSDQLRELVPDGPPEDLIRLMNDGRLLLCGAFRDPTNQWWFRRTDGRLECVTNEQATDRLCREHISNLT